MTPPEVPARGPEAEGAARPPAVSVCPEDASGLVTLTKRADFLACARGRKQPMPGFLLQGRPRGGGECIRVGFTASKKVGNAVARNRAKRRLRALARAVLREAGLPGWDYVLVARRDETAARPMAELEADLARALARLHPAA